MRAVQIETLDMIFDHGRLDALQYDVPPALAASWTHKIPVRVQSWAYAAGWARGRKDLARIVEHVEEATR